ncbi:MAG: phenylacetate--CoA ligase family protein [Verrucomicrobiales bacterium]
MHAKSWFSDEVTSLAERQLERVNRLLKAVAFGNRFYQEKLGRVFQVDSLSDFARRVPMTTKEELAADQASYPPYGRNLTRDLRSYTRFHQTSGTSGRPMIWLDDAEGWAWVRGNWEWVWREAGVAAGKSAFFPFSFGPFLGFWAGFESATRVGVRAIPGGGLGSEARLAMMARLRPEVLCCTPTYGLRLLEVAEELGLSAREMGVEVIIVAGEPGGSLPMLRERLETGWGARLVDHHGMTEVGPVTVSHPVERDCLKLHHESYLAEIIDPQTGLAVEEGETGELVLTTLGRHGSPLIRYRTGDLVRARSLAGEEGFVLAGGILGRRDDMVVVRGVNLYPGAVDEVVRGVPGVGEYRVRVSREGALAEIALEVEAEESACAELAKKLQEVFSLRIPVRRAAGSLESFELKARRWEG